jgi:4-amino-4-deoxy-L-arabinose transferase-like glycosyltransferase
MNARRWLLIILAAYSLMGVAYSWVVPLGEAPDEIDHFLYVRHLVEQRAFPVMRPIAADNDTMEANQPPLYYLLNAVVTAGFPMAASAELPQNACFTFDPHDGGRANFYLHDVTEQNLLSGDYLAFRVARLLSILQGVMSILLAFSIGRQLVPDDERVALLGAAILAFNPQFIFITASVNNDVLTAVLGSALVYLSMMAANRPAFSRFIGLGIVMGLALLTKLAMLALWPLPFVAGILVAIKGRHKLAVQAVSLLIFLPLLVAGWWYVRATRLYGDPLAWEVHLLAKGSEVLRLSPFTWADGLDFVQFHFQSYWAWFGWLKIQAPGWVYGLLAFGTILAMLGLLFVVSDWRQAIRNWGIANRQSPVSSPRINLTAVVFNSLAIAAIYVSLCRYIQTINWSGYQGRLAYAVAAPIATLLGLGWWRLALMGTKRLRYFSQNRILSITIFVLPAVVLFLLSLTSLGQLAISFARPALFTPAMSWHRLCRPTSAGFYIEAVDLSAAVMPGEVLPVTLAGYGLSAGQAVMELSLLDWDGVALATSATDLSWPERTPISATLRLVVPPEVLPARGRIQLRLATDSYDLPAVKIAPLRSVTAVFTHPLDINFNDEVILLGYDLQFDDAILHLTTYWQALSPLATDYTIFTHLLNSSGQLITQHDAQPQDGRYPTSIWDTGEVVMNEVTLTIPPGTQPGQIAIGLYRLDTLMRLPLVDNGETAVIFPIPDS